MVLEHKPDDQNMNTKLVNLVNSVNILDGAKDVATYAGRLASFFCAIENMIQFPVDSVCKSCNGKKWIFLGNGNDKQCEACFDNEPEVSQEIDPVAQTLIRAGETEQDAIRMAVESRLKVSQPVDSIRNYPEFVTDILRLSDATVSKDTKQQIRKSIYDTIDSRVANASPDYEAMKTKCSLLRGSSDVRC